MGCSGSARPALLGSPQHPPPGTAPHSRRCPPVPRRVPGRVTPRGARSWPLRRSRAGARAEGGRAEDAPGGLAKALPAARLPGLRRRGPAAMPWSGGHGGACPARRSVFSQSPSSPSPGSGPLSKWLLPWIHPAAAPRDPPAPAPASLHLTQHSTVGPSILSENSSYLCSSSATAEVSGCPVLQPEHCTVLELRVCRQRGAWGEVHSAFP